MTDDEELIQKAVEAGRKDTGTFNPQDSTSIAVGHAVEQAIRAAAPIFREAYLNRDADLIGAVEYERGIDTGFELGKRQGREDAARDIYDTYQIQEYADIARGGSDGQPD